MRYSMTHYYFSINLKTVRKKRLLLVRLLFIILRHIKAGYIGEIHIPVLIIPVYLFSITYTLGRKRNAGQPIKIVFKGYNVVMHYISLKLSL